MPTSETRTEKRGEEHAEQVQSMFDRIAPVYDLLNHVLSLGQDIRWRRKTVTDLSDSEMVRRGIVIDACGGTGDLAVSLARRSPDTRILLTDFAHEMLLRSEDKCRGMNIQTVASDALRLPLADETADGVMCAFGVRNLQDLRGGIREFGRVLRPGGRLMILEFMPGPKGFFGRPANFYVRRILPVIGRLLSRDSSAYTYLPESVEKFVTAEVMEKILLEEGFRVVRIRHFSFGVASEFFAERT